MAINRFTVTLAEELLGTFDENELTLEDAFVLENETGLTFRELLPGVLALRPKELRALVWFMRFKRGDQVRPESIDFKLVDLSTEAVPDPSAAGDSEGSETPISEPSPNTAA
jgi:hypothetical protein